jgi:mxaK protein
MVSMAMTRSHKRLLALLALLAAALAVDAVHLSRIRLLNRAIADGSVASLAGDFPPEAMFARAYDLERRGDHQAALNLYKQLESGGDRTLRQATQYNTGNVYLRQALVARDSDSLQQMLPLAELAKNAYREILREDSQDWDAKYNLERTLRLVPDPENVLGAEPPPSKERAPTTMKATSLGLP